MSNGATLAPRRVAYATGIISTKKKTEVHAVVFPVHFLNVLSCSLVSDFISRLEANPMQIAIRGLVMWHEEGDSTNDSTGQQKVKKKNTTRNSGSPSCLTLCCFFSSALLHVVQHRSLPLVLPWMRTAEGNKHFGTMERIP